MTSRREAHLEKAMRYLCPPGDGVHGMRVAGALRSSVQASIYGPDADVRAQWERSLAALTAPGRRSPGCVVLGVPSDTGGGVQRGANLGPLFVRESIVSTSRAVASFDVGDVRTIPHILHDKYLNDETINSCRLALYGEGVHDLPVSPLSIAYDFASEFYGVFEDTGLFTIGGDHSVSYPVVKAYLESRRRRGIRAALIHFDAHPDLMGERLGVDLCFASWARHVLQDLNAPEDLVQIGLRAGALDRAGWEARLGVTQVWQDEIARRGVEAISRDLVLRLARRNVQEVYVTFDIDVLDESYAGATGTPEPDGLTPTEAIAIARAISARFPVAAADVMEVAPQVRAAHIRQSEPETTLAAAAEVSTFLMNAIARHYEGAG